MIMKFLFSKGKQKKEGTKIHSVCLTSLEEKLCLFQALPVLDDTEKYLLRSLCLENSFLQVVREN